MLFLILLGIYMALGYWAAGKTIYSRAIMFGDLGQIFTRRLIMGSILGPVIIPIALIKTILGK